MEASNVCFSVSTHFQHVRLSRCPGTVSLGFSFGSGQWREVKCLGCMWLGRRLGIQTAAIPQVTCWDTTLYLSRNNTVSSYLLATTLQQHPCLQSHLFKVCTHTWRTVGAQIRPPYLSYLLWSLHLHKIWTRWLITFTCYKNSYLVKNWIFKGILAFVEALVVRKKIQEGGSFGELF